MQLVDILVKTQWASGTVPTSDSDAAFSNPGCVETGLCDFHNQDKWHGYLLYTGSNDREWLSQVVRTCS